MANEKRLADVDVLIADIEKRYCEPCKAEGKDYNEVACRACWVDDMRLEIDGASVVDAVEVVHGRWEKASETMPIYRCSICKERNLFKNGNNVLSNFCPNCGADMKDNKLNLEDIFDLEAQTKANNDAMRKVMSFMVDGAKMDGGNEDV